jgi:hypothetical protein
VSVPELWIHAPLEFVPPTEKSDAPEPLNVRVPFPVCEPVNPDTTMLRFAARGMLGRIVSVMLLLEFGEVELSVIPLFTQ